MEIKNNERECYVEICISDEDFPLANNFDAISVKRRVKGETDWTVIGKIRVADSSDFELTLGDLFAKSKEAYEYMLVPMTGTVDGVGITGEVYSDFGGVLVGTAEEWYATDLNVTVSATRHTAVNYINPFYSKYPMAVRNGNLDYCNGSVEGLFLPKKSDGNLSYEDVQTYKRRAINFLMNGEKKILKTADGDIFCVSIDADIEMPLDKFGGESAISFKWTEIDDVPTEDGIVMLL